MLRLLRRLTDSTCADQCQMHPKASAFQMEYANYENREGKGGNPWQDSCECFTLDAAVKFQEAITAKAHIKGQECMVCNIDAKFNPCHEEVGPAPAAAAQSVGAPAIAIARH